MQNLREILDQPSPRSSRTAPLRKTIVMPSARSASAVAAAFKVDESTPIGAKWREAGGAAKLGLPTAEMKSALAGQLRYQSFENGAIFFTETFGAVLLESVLFARWSRLGFTLQKQLGPPIADAKSIARRLNPYCALVALALIVVLEPSAHAVEGIFRGRVTLNDPRPPGTVSFTGTSNVLRNLLVEVKAVEGPQPDPPGDCCTVLNKPQFAVTDGNGLFTVRWEDRTRTGGVIPLRVTVIWASPERIDNGTSPPSASLKFSVRSFDASMGTAASNTFFLSQNLNAPAGTVTIVAPRNDTSAAYLTADEVFSRIVRHSAVLRRRMVDIEIITGAGDAAPGTAGVAPDRKRAMLTTGTPIANSALVAHELGHLITWNALGLAFAPYSPVPDFGLPDFQWSPETREITKVAFLEGMAEHWSAVWQFGQNGPALRRGSALNGNVIDLNFAAGRIVGGAGNLVLNCRSASQAWQFPFCNAAALRDLIDNDGDDQIDLTIADIVDILNRFPSCWHNGCLNEFGPDALNHNDFRSNAVFSVDDAPFFAAYALNGLANPVDGSRIGP